MAHLWHIRNLNPPVVVRVGPAPLKSAQVKRLRSRLGRLGARGPWHIYGTRPNDVDETPQLAVGANSDELKPCHEGSVCGNPASPSWRTWRILVGMSKDLTELSVSQARDHFSDAVNRAAFGGEITYVTRGRNQQRAAAIVPAELVEQYEAMIDLEDGRIALERLADLKAGRTAAVPADEAARALGL